MIRESFKRMFGMNRATKVAAHPVSDIWVPPPAPTPPPREFLSYRRRTRVRPRAFLQKASRRVNRGGVKRKKVA